MKIDHFQPDDWINVNPKWVQRFVRWFFSRPGRHIYRYRGYGHDPRTPSEGGFLLAPGPHGAFLDPFVFALGQKRTRMRFMAKYQVLEWFGVGRIVRWGGGFPIHRGGGKSISGLEVARNIVAKGEGLVMFMEGRLELDGVGLGNPRSGLARLALGTGAPVVPVAAWGSKRARAYGKRWWYHWPRVTVVWGEWIQFPQEEHPTEERVEEVRDAIWERVSRCFDQANAIAHRPSGRPPKGTPLGQALEMAGYELTPGAERT